MQYAVRSEGRGRIDIGSGKEFPKFEAGLTVQGIDFLVPGSKVYEVARTDRTGPFSVPSGLEFPLLCSGLRTDRIELVVGRPKINRSAKPG